MQHNIILKIRILCLAVIVFITTSIQGQEMLQMADLAIGYEPDGVLLRAGYSRLYGKHLITMAGQVHFEQHKVGRVNQSVAAQQYLVNVEYHYEILNYNDRDFSFFGGGGGIAGYENLNRTTISDGGIVPQQSDVVYGAFLGVTAEKYLFPIARSNALALLANLRYNYFFQSQLGEQQLNASIGVRYVF